MSAPVLPDRFESVAALEDLLSEPTPLAVETMARLDGDILILGVGGKMGPSLARLAPRAGRPEKRRIVAVVTLFDAWPAGSNLQSSRHRGDRL